MRLSKKRSATAFHLCMFTPAFIAGVKRHGAGRIPVASNSSQIVFASIADAAIRAIIGAYVTASVSSLFC